MIGLRIKNENYSKTLLPDSNGLLIFKNSFIKNLENIYNCTDKPNNYHIGRLYDIVDPNAPEDIYLYPVGCYGIIRRKEERGLKINKRLEEILLETSKQLPKDIIEKISLAQKRGKFSKSIAIQKSNNQYSLLDL